MQKKFKQILWLFCGLGFVFGIVYENVTYANQQSQNTFFQEDSLLQVLEKTIVSGEYFFYVLRMRLQMLLPVCIIGLVKWKKIFVNIFLVWTGFLFGAFLANAIIWQGVLGIILCITMLLPHMLFYVFGYYIILWNFYKYPEQRWNVRKIVVCCVCFLIGIVVETYVNPWFVKGVLNLFH